jgi:hypothetical protein
MPNIDQAHANSLVCYSLGNNGAGAPVATVGALHFRLMTANAASWAVNGTELPTGGGYVAGTGITPVTFVAVAAGAVTNSIVLSQTNMPASTIVGGELWDSAVTPARKWFGALSASKVCNVGDTFSVAIGAMSVGIG